MEDIHINKWGNSLAFRVPAHIARQLRFEEGSAARLSVENGRLVVTPKAADYDLASLLAGITPENRHEEINTGGPMGRET